MRPVIPLEFDIRKLSHWLSVFAMLCRVLALTYGLVLIRFHPHPILAIRTDRLTQLWWVACIYTVVLIGILVLDRDEILR